jgi:hypothetical protein
MNCDGGGSESALGFLTVIEDAQHGLFGGYLVLNAMGRPIEFHCSAPIRPNRAQQILYGPTLEPYLYGEQIGQTLITKAQVEPMVVCTDRAAALAVREHTSGPVALVLPSTDDQQRPETPPAGPTGGYIRVDRAHPGGPPLQTFQLGRNRLAVAEQAVGDRPLIEQRLSRLAESFDLTEPFGRIRQAIEEAQQNVR